MTKAFKISKLQLSCVKSLVHRYMALKKAKLTTLFLIHTTQWWLVTTYNTVKSSFTTLTFQTRNLFSLNIQFCTKGYFLTSGDLSAKRQKKGECSFIEVDRLGPHTYFPLLEHLWSNWDQKEAPSYSNTSVKVCEASLISRGKNYALRFWWCD